MQWRAGATLALVALVVLGGLVGPVAAEPRPEAADASPAVDAGGGAPGASDGGPRQMADEPPDPETDVLGWEDGYWHNETVAINQSDGVNETELDAAVARTMARVEHVRGLEFERTVPVEVRSREQFRAEQANRTTAPELRTFDNAKFEALLLVGEDEDSIAVQNENSGSNVLGFYSPASEAIVVISESADELRIEELTLAHELVHALQDQHFNLSRYDARTRDGANAESGLIEGDARLVELRYDRRCTDGPWNGTCLVPPPSFGGGGGGSLANFGVYIVKFMPYSDGPSFVAALYRGGGWEAVDAAYERPPTSSEQVILPDRYRNDEPTNVSLRDRTTEGWERVRPPDRPAHATVGQGALTAMLVFPLYDSNGRTQIVTAEEWFNTTDDGSVSSFDPLRYDHRYTTGWDGDRLHAYENDANETAYVWRLVWDGPADAREFVDGYLQALAYWGGERVAPNTWVVSEGGFADAFHVSVRGDTVTIVNAPTTEQLPQVRTGVEATTTPSPTMTVTPPGTAHNSSPATSAVPPGEPTSPGQPGFGALAALAALTLAMLARRRG